MTTQPVVSALTDVLGQTFRLYVQTHGYHWNVEGPAIPPAARDVRRAVPEPLGRVGRDRGAHPRSGCLCPCLCGGIDGPCRARGRPGAIRRGHGRRAIAEHEAIAATLRAAIATCADAGDEVSVGMLTDRLEWHEKETWMMRASTR